MNIIGIQAHSFSKRLPGKIYKKIGDKSLLQWCVESCREIAPTWVLGHVLDEELIGYCCDNDLPLYIGKADDQDVLSRYVRFCRAMRATSVTRVTSDCPFISVPELGYVVALHSRGFDFTSNCFAPRTIPDGYDTECVSARLLEYLDKRDTLMESREHVTKYIYDNVDTLKTDFRICRVKSALNLSHLKFSVDTQEDLDRLEKQYEPRG